MKKSKNQEINKNLFCQYIFEYLHYENPDFDENSFNKDHKLLEDLWLLFDLKFNPLSYNLDQYKIEYKKLKNQINKLGKKDKKIYNFFINSIEAMVRTNFYQEKICNSARYISCKFDCKKIEGLNGILPLYEVFIYSNILTGCYLRKDKISRGGIRWSTRQSNFRKEILSLMQAQSLKNSIIIPDGAKGGFRLTNYEKIKDDKKLLKKDFLFAYETLIKGLLDITDNILDGKIIKPKNMVCYDDDDPYLVVAADRGTSGMSDVANQISKEYKFWLGDAFASGSSSGYSHKKLGITSKGVWVSIKNHLKTLGIADSEKPITVAGIGDMSGDVFGNGLLQSKNIKLIGAFNHEYVFIDPYPDPIVSFEERKRLFFSEDASWNNYNKNIISNGGVIFSRSEKKITLNPDIKKVLSIPKNINVLSAEDLIKFLLKAQVDLIFLGGIGTFIKGNNQSNDEIKDISNDKIRINASDVRAKIIAEGANLGVSQQARIDYTIKGGLINTDFIDNSAGVNCSDYEVNLKILLQLALKKGKINPHEILEILEKIEEDVVELVLQNNQQQNAVINKMLNAGKMEIAFYKNTLYQALENYKIEEFFSKLKKLTRPDLCVVLSFEKIALKKELLELFRSKKISKTFFNKILYKYARHYYPKYIVNNFKSEILEHPLAKEILATTIVNIITSHYRLYFIYDLSKKTGYSIGEIILILSNIEYGNKVTAS
jgi:glutamate dehydrogenase